MARFAHDVNLRFPFEDPIWSALFERHEVESAPYHLRNHAFLRTSTSGWTLSPAFDLNPDPEPGERLLKTAIDLDENEAAVEPLMGIAEWFRLDAEDAVAEDAASESAREMID